MANQVFSGSSAAGDQFHADLQFDPLSSPTPGLIMLVDYRNLTQQAGAINVMNSSNVQIASATLPANTPQTQTTISQFGIHMVSSQSTFKGNPVTTWALPGGLHIDTQYPSS